MRTNQMTLDDELVPEVDRVVKLLRTSRSAFTRKAPPMALSRYNLGQVERKHQEGDERFPVAAYEFSVWESGQAWVDE